MSGERLDRRESPQLRGWPVAPWIDAMVVGPVPRRRGDEPCPAGSPRGSARGWHTKQQNRAPCGIDAK